MSIEQSIIITSLPRAVRPSNRDDYLGLAVSLYLAPRIHGNPGRTIFLRERPLFLNWPRVIQNSQFTVFFEGLAEGIRARVTSQKLLNEDLWQRIFTDSMPIDPYEAPTNFRATPSVARSKVFAWYRRTLVEKRIRQIYMHELNSTLARHLNLNPKISLSEPTGADLPDWFWSTPGEHTNAEIAKIFSESTVNEEFNSLKYTELNDGVWPLVAETFSAFHRIHEGSPNESASSKANEVIFVEKTDHDRVFETSKGTHFVLPDSRSLNPGFSIRVGNRVSDIGERAGNIVLIAPASGDTINGASSAVVPKNCSVYIRTPADGAWEMYPEQRADFHACLSAASEYGVLLRKLGIAVDLEVDIEKGSVNALTGRVRAEVVLDEQSYANLRDDDSSISALRSSTLWPSPWTHFNLSPELFLPTPRNLPGSRDILTDGFLRLSTFHPIQVDLDGAIIKKSAQETAEANASLKKNNAPSTDLGTPESNPSLRSTGISLSVDNRTWDTIKSVSRQEELEDVFHTTLALSIDDGSPTSDLYAEDVLAGFRVDIRCVDSRDSKWHPLCARENTLDQPTQISLGVDEGFVSTAVSHADAGPDKSLHKTTDTLLTWNGWSLVVPRIGEASPGYDGVAPSTARDVSTAWFPFTVLSSVVPGTLVPYRIGQVVELRARMVDLACNGLTVTEADSHLASHGELKRDVCTVPIRITRAENVAPPILIPLQPQPDKTTGDILILQSDIHGNSSTRQWLILPPAVGIDRYESHGMLDGIWDLPRELWSIFLKRHDTSAPTHFDANWFRNVQLPTGGYRIPYLADPMAKYLRIDGLPNESGHEIFSFDVPKTVERVTDNVGRAVVLEIMSGAFRTMREKHKIRIYIPPGEQLTLQMSCVSSTEELDNFLQWTWLDETLRKHINARKLVASGEIPALSPRRTIRAIHVVPRPTHVPSIKAVRPTPRSLMKSTAEIDLEVDLDSSSTGELEVEGRSIVLLDNGSQEGWISIETDDVAFTHIVPFRNATTIVSGKHVFPDTKFRRVSYLIRGIGRYDEYYEPEIRESRVSQRISVAILSSAPPPPPEVDYIVPTFGWENRRTHRTTNVSRFGNSVRIYVRRPWFSTGDGEELALLFRPSNGVSAPGVLTTEWGSDPVRVGGEIQRPMDMKDIANASSYMANIDVIHGVTGADSIYGSRMKQEIYQYDVASFPVFIADDRRYVYSDIEFNTSFEYFPFIRICAARCQRNSVHLATLSDAVHSLFISLAPNRFASVRRNFSTYSVRITGSGPIGFSSQPNSVVIAYEEFDESFHAETKGSLFNWYVNEPSTVPLTPVRNPDGSWVWEGEIPVHLRKSPDSRILVREYENFPGPEPTERQSFLVFTARLPLP